MSKLLLERLTLERDNQRLEDLVTKPTALPITAVDIARYKDVLGSSESETDSAACHYAECERKK